jgi:predicted DNA-binding transcriptional regulator YafY
LDVTVRTGYRDIATLQARRIPIEGAPGIGYVLRRGFELPPLMFTEDEAEAIAVGVRMLARLISTTAITATCIRQSSVSHQSLGSAVSIGTTLPSPPSVRASSRKAFAKPNGSGIAPRS